MQDAATKQTDARNEADTDKREAEAKVTLKVLRTRSLREGYMHQQREGAIRQVLRSMQISRTALCCGWREGSVDLQVLGQRHIDIKNGLSDPPALKFENLVNMMTKPGWVFSVLSGKRWTFGNIDGYVKGAEVSNRSRNGWATSSTRR